MNIVGVTACLSGVAHTYMAAELLEKKGRELGYLVRVETQGALGCENRLTEAQINDADVALIIADIPIDGEQRFAQARLLRLPISRFLCDPLAALLAAEKLRSAPPQTRWQG